MRERTFTEYNYSVFRLPLIYDIGTSVMKTTSFDYHEKNSSTGHLSSPPNNIERVKLMKRLHGNVYKTKFNVACLLSE